MYFNPIIMNMKKHICASLVICLSFLLIGCQGESITPTHQPGITTPTGRAVTPTEEAELPPASDITKMQIVR